MKALATIILCLGLLWPGCAAAARLALVIGIDDYDNITPLSKAVGDAEAMAETLDGLGFEVTKFLNPDRRTLNQAVTAFRRSLKPGDAALVHFSGHGVEVKGHNLLLPSDIPAVPAGEEDYLIEEAIDLAGLIDRVSDSGAAVRIFIIDACRSNPIDSLGERGLNRLDGLAPLDPPKGSFVLYSAASRQAALDELGPDDTSPTSVYTRVLLAKLKQPGLTLSQIAREVRVEVAALAVTVGRVQSPAYYDELNEEFVLSPLEPKPEVAPVPAPAADDAEAFALAKSFNSVAAWEAFLKTYRTGFYADLARVALDQLKAQADSTVLVTPAEASKLDPGCEWSSAGWSGWLQYGDSDPSSILHPGDSSGYVRMTLCSDGLEVVYGPTASEKRHLTLRTEVPQDIRPISSKVLKNLATKRVLSGPTEAEIGERYGSEISAMAATGLDAARYYSDGEVGFVLLQLSPGKSFVISFWTGHKNGKEPNEYFQTSTAETVEAAPVAPPEAPAEYALAVEFEGDVPPSFRILTFTERANTSDCTGDPCGRSSMQRQTVRTSGAPGASLSVPMPDTATRVCVVMDDGSATIESASLVTPSDGTFFSAKGGDLDANGRSACSFWMVDAKAASKWVLTLKMPDTLPATAFAASGQEGLVATFNFPIAGTIVGWEIFFAFSTECENDGYAEVLSPTGRRLIVMGPGPQKHKCGSRQTWQSQNDNDAGAFMGSEARGDWKFVIKDMQADTRPESLDAVWMKLKVTNNGVVTEHKVVLDGLPREIPNPS